MLIRRTKVALPALNPGDPVTHPDHGLCRLDAIAHPARSPSIAFITDRRGEGQLCHLRVLCIAGKVYSKRTR